MPFELNATGEKVYTVLPAVCTNLLPFQPEPLRAWTPDTDLVRYADRLSAESDVSLDSNGLEMYQPPKVAVALAQELSRKTEPPMDYMDDAVFGAFAKAWIAWSWLDEELLSEGGFFSLAHVLEASSDLECALELIKKFYYRQACICLRTFVEDLVYPLYFLTHEKAFTDWKAGRSQLPTVRGEDGILAKLVRKGYLTQDLSHRLGSIYGKQNSAVHGHVDAMIHAGALDDKWRGLTFKRDEATEWFSVAKESIECGLLVVKHTSDLWLATRRGGPFVCSLCHSTDFDVTRRERKPARPSQITIMGRTFDFLVPEQDDRSMYDFKCKGCGHMILSSISGEENEARKRKTT